MRDEAPTSENPPLLRGSGRLLVEAGFSLLKRLLSGRGDARWDDDAPEYYRAAPLRCDEVDGPCRLPCEEEVEAFK